MGLHFLSLVQRPLHPPDEGPKVSEFLQKRLVGEELDVLYVVVRLVCSAAMVYLLLVLGLVWVDALEYTQTPFLFRKGKTRIVCLVTGKIQAEIACDKVSL